MKAIVALVLLVAAALVGAPGCHNAPQGNGESCMPLMPGGTGCFFPPTAAAQRTGCGDVTDYCDATAVSAPNLSCLGAMSTAPATPATVTLTGFVHAFSSGPDTNNLGITIWDASTANGNDPTAAQPIATATAKLDASTERACDADPSKGCSIPLANGCQTPTCNDGLMGRADDKKYCRDLGNGSGECSDRLRWEARYSIANVPTNRQLVVKVAGPDGSNDAAWATTAAFNIFLATNDRACKDASDTDCIVVANATYQLNLNALSRADYVNIPTISGLSGGIATGKGAIAGEVHDCDNIRVANVEVSTTPAADRLTYFNGNPIMTLPDSSRASIGTDRLGLFAALNQATGKVHIDTAGATTVGGPLVSFGTVDAFVYAGQVTVVNVNGGRGTR